MKEGKRVLSVSHSLCEKTGLAIHSVLPHHPLPETIFLAATHTHTLLQSVDIHTRRLIPTPPSISAQDNPSPTHPHIPSLSKKIFPRVWNANGHLRCWQEEPKVVLTCRWMRSKHNKNSEDTRTRYADDGICLFQIITPLFVSLQLYLVQPGQIAVLVNMENSRTIDPSGIVIVVCSLLSILANVNVKE